MVLVEIAAEVTVLEVALVRADLVVAILVQAVVAALALVRQVALGIAALDVVAHVKQDVLDVLEIALANVAHAKDAADVVLVDVVQHAEATVVDIV